MVWFKAVRNSRVGRARYLTGEVVDLDPKLLVGKEDNFVACDAPASAKAEPVKPAGKAKKDAPKAEVKTETDAKADASSAPTTTSAASVTLPKSWNV